MPNPLGMRLKALPPSLDTIRMERLARQEELRKSKTTTASLERPKFPGYTPWLKQVNPELNWDYAWLKYVRDQLARVTRGELKRLAISVPPQHGKTTAITERYPLWRMLREPGIRVGIGSYNQWYANKIAHRTRRIARRLGLQFDSNRAEEWDLVNGSSYVARGVGAGISGIPLDLFVIDDPFRGRKDADSETVQERVYEWYMDDVVQRLQKDAALVLIMTRWNPGDLIGRIQESAEAHAWEFVRLPAVAETQAERDQVAARTYQPLGLPDPIGRKPGQALCPERYPIEALESRRLAQGVGFESTNQQNPVPRGGMMFDRTWFGAPVPAVPMGKRVSRIRYWDLACLVAGTMIETSIGLKPIEAIEAGEFVMTRSGYRRVKWSGVTKVVESVTSVEFDNGSIITGTDDHRVWTQNRGWVPLGQLTGQDECIDIGGVACLGVAGKGRPTQSSLSSTGSPTPVNQAGGISRRCGGISPPKGITATCSTGRSGCSTTGTSRSAMTFTTAIGTPPTTPSRILSASSRPTTPAGTTPSPHSTPRLLLPNTTGGLSKRFGITRPTRRIVVSNAAEILSRGEVTRRNSARSTAGPCTATTLGVPVYDLEVEVDHEFFANGVLVHNSSRKDSACFTSGVLMACVWDESGKKTFYIEDVIRGRWHVGERNNVIAQTAAGDQKKPGYQQTYFEAPTHDLGKESSQAITSACAGLRVYPDSPSGSGSKELRAEPAAAAAKAGLIRLVAGSWNAAYLSELEAFPKGTYKDQVDGTSGAFNKLALSGGDAPNVFRQPQPQLADLSYAQRRGLYGL